jgi:diguanylate cyclase (GGDEF)-like protein
MRILIADDSAAARAMLQRAIAALGHECTIAEDGAEAWKLYSSLGADVIISDWLMPGIDGDELCRRVRRGGEHPYTYFILLSSLDDAGHLLRGMEAGADDYLKKPFSSDELQAKLISAARVTTLHASLQAQHEQLELLNRRLFEESRTDQLTQLGNRIALGEHVTQLNAYAGRYEHSYGIAMFDLDCFKQYNDACGHLAGDRILQTVAATIAGQCRRGDGAYRYGGEELLVVLPEQGNAGTAAAAERMRVAVESLAIPHPGCPVEGVVTVSAGVAALQKMTGEDFDAVLRRADAALYRAKADGRNRVHASAAPTVRSG